MNTATKLKDEYQPDLISQVADYISARNDIQPSFVRYELQKRLPVPTNNFGIMFEDDEACLELEWKCWAIVNHHDEEEIREYFLEQLARDDYRLVPAPLPTITNQVKA